MKVLIFSLFFYSFFAAGDEVSKSPVVIPSGSIFNFSSVVIPKKCNAPNKRVYIIGEGKIVCQSMSLAFKDNCEFVLSENVDLLKSKQCALKVHRTNKGVSVLEFKEAHCPRVLCYRGIAQLDDFSTKEFKAILGIYSHWDSSPIVADINVDSTGKNAIKENHTTPSNESALKKASTR